MNDNLTITVMGEKRVVNEGLTYSDLSKDYQKLFKNPIILAKVGNYYHELKDKIDNNDDIVFVDKNDKFANRAYLHALVFVASFASEALFGKKARINVKYSVDKGIYITTSFPFDEEKCKQLKEKMNEIIKKDMEIRKCHVERTEALEYFQRRDDSSKTGLLKYNVNTYVTLYNLGGMYDYFFSYMPSSTGVLKEFDLHYLDNHGFVLMYPFTNVDKLKEYVHHQKIFDVFKEYQKWAELMKIENVSELNNIVSNGKADDIIRIEEMIQSYRLIEIVKTIVLRKNPVKVILIAGPSSSGKTTTCKKLSMYLRGCGLEPREISMDDYFVDREDNPKDENGEYDFECLEAVNIKAFDTDVKKLINGEKVKLRTFDFITGKSSIRNEETELGKNEILIIEGIHALDDRILTSIDRDKKFKIYISPLTVLNIDSHNRISSTDNRLIRRIVRDNRTRGYKVDVTIKGWKKVREGEVKHVFPNQDDADVTFNTALIYEMGVLKTYAEPLLYSVNKDSPYYEDARRLINTLKTILPIPSDAVPDDSLIREFIGGSCF